MFNYDLLNNLDEKDTTDVVYYLIKILKKTKNETKIEDIPNDLSKELINIAESVFGKLESEKLLEDENEVEKVINDLSNYLEDKFTTETPEGIIRGKELLEKLDLF